MGTPTNYLLGGQQNLLGADPEVYRQQLIQREQQRIAAMPPQQGLASALGGLIGRGVANVANDRGFFEVTDPVLQKLTTIQNVYDNAIKNSDPNDPMSFFTNLQKDFAAQGLGQQALMAQLEGKKFEDMNLKTEKTKMEVWKSNPAILDAAIEKARNDGNDTLANNLAQTRGQIQVDIDMDRAKQVAGLALINAQTANQKASAQRQIADIEAGKSDWKIVNDDAGVPTAFAIFDKKNRKITYEKIGGGEYIPGGSSGKKDTAPKGERPPLTSFSGNTAAPAPVATATTPSAPMAASNTTVSLYDQNTRTYKLTQDPEYLQIAQLAASNQQRLETDPAFQAQIQQAMNQLKAKRQAELGSFVQFQ